MRGRKSPNLVRAFRHTLYVVSIDRLLARSLTHWLASFASSYRTWIHLTEVVNLRKFAGRRFFRGFFGALSSRAFNAKQVHCRIFLSRWHWADLRSKLWNFGRVRNAKSDKCILWLNKPINKCKHANLFYIIYIYFYIYAIVYNDFLSEIIKTGLTLCPFFNL